MTLFPWIEANEGLLSILLSTVAIGAAGFVAWREHERAEDAEAARTREPAQAALSIIDAALAALEKGKESENAAHEAMSYARRALVPLSQIAAAPVPSASLTLALHGAAEAMRNLASAMVPAESAAGRAQSCGRRIGEFQQHRPEIARHAAGKRKAPPVQSNAGGA